MTLLRENSVLFPRFLARISESDFRLLSAIYKQHTKHPQRHTPEDVTISLFYSLIFLVLLSFM